MIDKTILLGDIGGTNARFALTSPNDSSYTCFEKFRCVNFDTAIEAINCYLKDHDIDNLHEIYLAIAAPVSGDKVKIINNHCLFNGFWVLPGRSSAPRPSPSGSGPGQGGPQGRSKEHCSFML